VRGFDYSGSFKNHFGSNRCLVYLAVLIRVIGDENPEVGTDNFAAILYQSANFLLGLHLIRLATYVLTRRQLCRRQKKVKAKDEGRLY
jgi:hypothetical protein